jgi:hypothetical protein
MRVNAPRTQSVRVCRQQPNFSCRKSFRGNQGDTGTALQCGDGQRPLARTYLINSTRGR